MAACGAPSRGDDAAPVQEDVPPAPATVEAAPTPVPVETAEVGETPPAGPEPTVEPAPDATGQAAVSLTINGGIIGFCDSLVVDRSGAYVWQTTR